MGGLTVLAALRAALPAENFIYLGDTARLPYGTKSGETVVRYAIQASDALVGARHQGTGGGLQYRVGRRAAGAARTLRALPVIGVVEPGAAAACAATRAAASPCIATEGTVRGGAYQRAIMRLRPAAQREAVACQLFVALAEEGWIDGAVAAVRHRAAAISIGVAIAVRARQQPARLLVLGCTHFPVLLGHPRSSSGPM